VAYTRFLKPLADRYNWCQGPVPGRGPAVEKHWPKECSFSRCMADSCRYTLYKNSALYPASVFINNNFRIKHSWELNNCSSLYSSVDAEIHNKPRYTCKINSLFVATAYNTNICILCGLCSYNNDIIILLVV